MPPPNKIVGLFTLTDMVMEQIRQDIKNSVCFDILINKTSDDAKLYLFAVQETLCGAQDWTSTIAIIVNCVFNDI